MGEFLYYLTIKPIWLLFEIIYVASCRIFSNPGLSILSVSIVMNILVLPMYLRADALQEEERSKQKKMEYWVKHIRKTFKGDERFMMLSEYYRQNDYQPYYVLKSSLSLLLQVPFFVAAYDFLSNLTLLQGTSFLMIRDLGSPDGLITFGGISVNILPILMTTINLISAFIYTRNGTRKEKVQTVVFALVFLVLLYNSPAGLVFYWTLNNVFSLIKNTIMILIPHKERSKEAAEKGSLKEKDPVTTRIWAISSLLLAVFTGLAIPLSVIEASPMDFAETLKYPDPTRYALLSFAIATGTFVLWGSVVYFLGNMKFRKVLSRVIMCCSVIFIVNHMVFSEQFGIISVNLDYDNHPSYDMYSEIFNLIFIIQAVLILLVMFRKNKGILVNALTILVVCVSIFAIYNYVSIEKEVRSSHLFAKNDESEEYGTMDINNRILKFSRNKKNVVVMMLDRSIGAMLPYMIEEKPELAEIYSGFTYYPNTVSTGTETVNGAPGLFGGYEYTMEELNKRDGELVRDKINEGLKVLPTVFGKEGYHSTMIDIPYCNLGWFVTEHVIYDDVENCDTYHVQWGEYAEYMNERERACLSLEQQKRNFFFYSLFRSAPLILQNIVYDDGDYLSITCNSMKAHFITNMVYLRLMPELTEVVDEDQGELIVMMSDAPHEPTLLNPPDYEPDPSARIFKLEDRVLSDGRVMSIRTRGDEAHYDANMATFIKVGKWLEHLKEIGVYDNTRIIIVADHGFAMNQFSYMAFDNVPVDAEGFNPILLVKDYDSKGDLVTDNTFMTNADVPTIAVENVIENPVNPYTGKPINNNRKFEGPMVVVGEKFDFDEDTQTVFDAPSLPWYSVHDDIFNPDNWKLIRAAQ